MLEQRRVDYLKAMGITMWMPREALPHAAPSRWLPEANKTERHDHIALKSTHDSARPQAAADLLRAGQPLHEAARESLKPEGSNAGTPDAHSSNHQPAHSFANTPTGNSQVGQGPLTPAGDMQTHESAPQVLTAETPSVERATAEAAGEVRDLTPPRFALEFMHLSPKGVWVVDKEQPLLPLQQMAAKALRGVGGAAAGVIPQPVSFRWPFIESRHQDQSEAVALQALRAQWEYFNSQGAEYVITIGENSRRWLEKTGAPLHHHIADANALMSSPAEKRALWLALVAVSGR